MSEQSPYEKLGVTENASFEEIQEAKKRLSQEYQDDSRLLQSIEAAYDAVIMDRLRLRQEGKIKVPERIRFPERTVETPPKLTLTPPSNAPNWLQRLIDTPSKTDILIPAVVFLLLGAIAIVTYNPINLQGSLLSLMMAVGFAATIYFLNRKEQRLGRSLLIAIISLVLGVALGGALATLLLTQGLTGGLVSEEIAALLTLFLFWLSSSFLR